MFKLTSVYKPTGDQPEAIAQLTNGLNEGSHYQVLQGVTGSGKTFTVANVIQAVQRPTLVLSHNKTLAAQLYSEFKAFFPANAVEYFVSYYDYFQPEAYLPVTNTYIEKEIDINEELDKLRLRATASLLSGRRDVLVVSSVSCLYSMADPRAFGSNIIFLERGMKIARNQLLRQLVNALYTNSELEFKRGSFRAKGETVDIFPSVESFDGVAYRVEFWGEEIERLSSFVPQTGQAIDEMERLNVYPANLFVTDKEAIADAVDEIKEDLARQVEFLQSVGKHVEAKRLDDRVRYDVEMLRELGYCSGVENYSRYIEGRAAGQRPFCLLDYFPEDFLLIVDESHATLPQVKAMYGGDRARKQTLVEYGFRLPASFDNRPLTIEEFEERTGQTIYVSATPSVYELEKSGGVIVEQVIRPTGILDPVIEVVPSKNQIDHLLHEINLCVKNGDKVLVTTLTKRMAEELDKFFARVQVNSQYIHSSVETLDRIQILENLRQGTIDVLVGVNLLREGLDLPSVALVAILDADKEGFLRSSRALIQTAGRAARNLNGKVIMYADTITRSMQATIDETNYRREKQLEYNRRHGITPRQIRKNIESVLTETSRPYYTGDEYTAPAAADPVIPYLSVPALQKMLKETKAAMQAAAKEMDFLQAAQFRDEMFKIEEQLEKMTGEEREAITN
ncbi:MAG: excinuclease ABC subunit UvrB [Odoribacteraceae bacterium]|jgi:excinuclease ABC subunit B|nr:excinuclease ABC subunit UvrB [Odoribacteraceae bacterium]